MLPAVAVDIDSYSVKSPDRKCRYRIPAGESFYDADGVSWTTRKIRPQGKYFFLTTFIELISSYRSAQGH
jgi:hypothetical protein